MAFSSHHGVCSSTDPSVLRKGGGPLAKMLLCLLCSRLPQDQIVGTWFTPACAKQQTALCCQWVSRPSNRCRVSGYRQRCGSNSQGSRWRDSPFWPGCFWKYVSWGPPVCTNQDLTTLAPQSKYSAAVMSHLLCASCLGLATTGHAQRSPCRGSSRTSFGG